MVPLGKTSTTVPLRPRYFPLRVTCTTVPFRISLKRYTTMTIETATANEDDRPDALGRRLGEKEGGKDNTQKSNEKGDLDYNGAAPTSGSAQRSIRLGLPTGHPNQTSLRRLRSYSS